MEKIITYDNLRSFAYVNDKICQKPIKGIVLSFFGLGKTVTFDVDTKEGEMYAERGIIYVYPYNNPWNWMNKQAIDFTDEIIDVLFEHYDLPCDTPIVSSGGSMGGHGALVYTAYAKRTPVACVTNCPVCDAFFHNSERPDLPRTYYSSFYNEEGSFEDALKRYSPFHLAEKMPKIKYRILHCEKDKSVNIDLHSKAFVKQMESFGHDITLDIVEGRGHCNLTLSAQRKFEQYIIESIEK